MANPDLTGQRFGRLVVLGKDESRAGKWRVFWHCQCDCGGKKSTTTNHLRAGRARSCGCYMRERATEANLKHGQSDRHGRQKPSRLYVIWRSMKGRCENPHNQDYERYGGRGIRVCAQWANYLAFEAWAKAQGYAPHLSIDRIDSDGHYSPENCRWASATTQSRNRSNNRSLTYRGRTACLAEHAEIVGLSAKTVASRLALGWTVERALGTPRLKLGPTSAR